MIKYINEFDNRQHMNNETFEIFHYNNQLLEEIPIHNHDFFEIYIFIKGEAEFRIGSNIYKLKPNNIMLTGPQIFHQPFIGKNMPYERIIIWINKNYINQELEQFLNKVILLEPNSDQFSKIYSFSEELIKSENEKDFNYKIYSKSLLNLLLIEIIKCSLKNEAFKKELDHNPLISKTLSYIENHFTKDISCNEICKKLKVSESYLLHQFKEEVGTSLYQYIILKRLSYSKTLIDQGYSPQEVAELCGFNDYINFYRCFKKNFETSPREYKKNQTNKN